MSKIKERGNIGIRLGILYFLQYGIWGSYLTCLGQFLGNAGLGGTIAWFYAAAGIVTLFMPALAGHIADRYASGTRLLCVCHLSGSVLLWLLWSYAGQSSHVEFAPFFTLYILFLCFYMPTPALANTITFGLLKQSGIRPVDSFGKIRIWGTIGFVAAMWFVNSAWWHNGSFGFTLEESDAMSAYRFQYTRMQLLSAMVMSVATAAYTLTLPKPDKHPGKDYRGIAGLANKEARELLRGRQVGIFLILAVLSGVCLQITNGFATPYISHFRGIAEYAKSEFSGNATMLFSLSQISEAACVLLVGVSVRRLGIRRVMIIALTAWSLRFLLFAFGNPGDGLWMLIASMIIYGIAFNYFSIAGQLYMEQVTGARHRGLGQGILMLMSSGIGASIGTVIAGAVVNTYCHWETVSTAAGEQRLFMGDWSKAWSIFAVYAGIVAMLYLLFFHPGKDRRSK